MRAGRGWAGLIWLPALGLLGALLVLRYGPTVGRGVDVREVGGLEFCQVPGGVALVGSPVVGDRRRVELAGFWMGAREVSNRVWAEFAREHGREVPVGAPEYPVAYVARSDAEAFCAWFSRRYGCRARLPTAAEWEWAARGGRVGLPYPWGFAAPEGRAQFRAQGPAPVGSFAANPLGLFDCAGNVFEWCAGEPAAARGGAWSERHPEMLQVFRATRFAEDYRDADVGFRVLLEEARVLLE